MTTMDDPVLSAKQNNLIHFSPPYHFIHESLIKGFDPEGVEVFYKDKVVNKTIKDIFTFYRINFLDTSTTPSSIFYLAPYYEERPADYSGFKCLDPTAHLIIKGKVWFRAISKTMLLHIDKPPIPQNNYDITSRSSVILKSVNWETHDLAICTIDYISQFDRYSLLEEQ